MGTNFYFYVNGREYQHIGKRSAAGPYCWDCSVSLCANGNDSVHQPFSTRFLDRCPVCNQKLCSETLDKSSVGRELGFNKTKPGRKTGIKSCSSFTWAISPGHFADLNIAPNTEIRDEYGRLVQSFQAVLQECPIQFFDKIGKEFS